MSYLRETDRFDNGLPSISRSGILDSSVRRGLTTIESREPVFYQRPSSPTYQRKHTQEMQDQIRLYRDEIARKEALISQLTAVDTGRKPKSYDSSLRIEEMYSNDRIANTAADKSEIAVLQVKTDGLQSQVRELQVQLDIREEKIRELKMIAETSRESEAKHAAIANQFRARLVEYEAHAGNIEGAASRSEVAISSLQRQTHDQQEKIVHLESRLRSMLEERERSAGDRIRNEQSCNELMSRIGSVLCLDGSRMCVESVTSRVTDLTQENAMMRGKLNSMKEYLSNAELETKASRETIMRLVSEADREQRVATKYTMQMDQIKMDHETSVSHERDMLREIEILKERLDASQRAWNATRTELEERETRFNRNDTQIREYETNVRTMEQTVRSFKEQLASLLSDQFNTVEPYEEQIRERVTHLVRSNSDKTAHIDLLEQKMNSVTGQLEKQYDVHRSGDHRLKQTESDNYQLQDRLKRAESELASADMLRDRVRGDKDLYFRFLEDLSVVLKMESINLDIGMDSIVTSIMARVQQLVGKEGDALIDRKTHIYNLQRKIKSLKEQLDSKELHMDLLRKKVASMEERMLGRSDMEREKDEEFVKNRKLLKLVDKYKCELNERLMEVQDLKARLLESSDIRNRTLEQERDLENLESKVGQLEHVRLKQAEKITGLKGELQNTAGRLNEKRDMAHQTVHTLSAELKAIKLALQEVTNRERQLLDLRQVVSRMMGLDVNSLAVPDYEIISRLEKLILANQSNVATVVALDSALEDVSDGFRSGYENASRVMHSRVRSPVRVARTAGMRTRTRSMSPMRKRDTRAY